MSGLAALWRRLGARARGIDERAPADAMNTQFVVQLSGYAWVARTFGPLRGWLVLDAACGEGYGADVLSSAGARVVGIDRDPLVARAAARTHPSGRFLAADAAALALREGVFDVVISQDTLEHVDDDHGFVAEIHRVLKPGGRLILFTPHAAVHTPRPANPFHRREYSMLSLQALLAGHFDGVRLFGRRSGSGLAAAESVMDSVRRYDPLGLRRWLVPRLLRHRLGDWVARRRTGIGLAELSVADVEYFEDATASGTLIAVCVKDGGVSW